MNLEDYDIWDRYFRNIIEKIEPARNPPGTVTILPMAGRGNRFVEKSYDRPKPLLQINEKPMVVQAVSCIPASDLNVFACLAQHNEEYRLEEILKESFSNARIQVIRSVTEGQACTCEIVINEQAIQRHVPIQISACDNGVAYDTKKYQEIVNDLENDVIVWTFRGHSTSKNNPNAYAWLDVDNDGFIKHVSCKKFIYEDPATTHAIIGTMFFRKSQYFTDGLHENYKKNIRTN